MRATFDAKQGLIIVHARLLGPKGQRTVRLAVDTGSTSTLISQPLIEALGYEPAEATKHVGITTASDMQYMPVVMIASVSALGLERKHFRVVSHTLPTTTTVHGVLGLDFLRGTRLTIDLIDGIVEVTEGRP